MIDQHRIPPLSVTRVPRAHVFIDTEARVEPEAGGMTQTWRLGAAQYLTLDSRRPRSKLTAETYTDPVSLWRAVSEFARANDSCYVWAHNLSYDARISRALTILPRLGWLLDGIPGGPSLNWLRFKCEGGHLHLIDLAHWCPAPLDHIARDLGMSRPPLPAQDADDSGFAARCMADVNVLRAAALRLLAWVETEQLGSFKPTAAGQSFSAWRVRHMTHNVWRHDHEPALQAERLAAWCGRTEAWRHGHQTAGPFTEMDLPQAYCRVAAECHLPAALDTGREVEAGPLRPSQLRYGAVLAHVRVRTDVPLVPAMKDGAVVWPVGTFDTCLWDPELSLLLDHGAEVEVIHGWRYLKAPVLRSAAAWILEQLGREAGAVDPIVRRALKHWSRTLIGRFAMRYRQWELEGYETDLAFRHGLYVDEVAGQTAETLQVGRRAFILAGERNGDMAAPMITGWVQSECRRRIWQLAVRAGLDHVLYIDTDSLITDPEGTAQLLAAARAGEAWGLRPKGEWPAVTLRGPRNLTLGSEDRVAGLPARRREIDAGRREVEVWAGWRTAMVKGQAESVVITPRVVKLGGRDRRRVHLSEGLTRPHRLREGAPNDHHR